MGWNSGVVVANQVIIEGNSAGLFAYNGTPGPGTLIASITAASGTDQYGNAYHAVASFGNQAGAYANIDSAGDISVTNSAGKAVLIIQAKDGAVLTYSATAGAGSGTLLIAQAAASGTDKFSNSYPAGFTVFGSGAFAGSYVSLENGQILFQGASGQNTAAIIQSQDTAGFLDLNSGKVTGGDTAADLFIESASASGGAGSTISMTASNVLANGNNLGRLFGNLDPSGYPLSGSATLPAVITTLNSTIQRFQNMGVFQ